MDQGGVEAGDRPRRGGRHAWKAACVGAATKESSCAERQQPGRVQTQPGRLIHFTYRSAYGVHCSFGTQFGTGFLHPPKTRDSPEAEGVDTSFYALGGVGGLGAPGTEGAAAGAGPGLIERPPTEPLGMFGISGKDAPHFLQVLSVGSAVSPHAGQVLSMERAAGLKHI